MEYRHHDLVVIGTGSGNSVITPRLDHLDIGLVEKGRFGGTCLNVGCIPTKMFVVPADRVVEAREAARLGVHVDGVRADWPAIRDRIFGRIDPIADDGEAYREKAENVTVYREQARFTGPMTLDTGTGVTVTADRWVIAAGGRPRLLDVDGLDRVDPDRGVHTSDTVMRMEALPKRVVIVGGGFIAAEFAHILDALGSHVTWVHRGERLLEHQDESVSRAYTEIAQARHDVRLKATVTAARHGAGGLDPDGGRGGRAHDGDRRPTRCCSPSGGTSTPTSWTSRPRGSPATTTAVWSSTPSSRRRSAGCSPSATSAASGSSSTWPTTRCGSSSTTCCTRTAPSRATTGSCRTRSSRIPRSPRSAKTEQELREAGVPYRAYEQQVGDVAYGWALEDTTGFCKVIVDPDTMQLLGAHLMAPHASTLIQPLLQAAHFGQRADDVAKGQYWIHPALAEVVENALLGL